MRYPQLNENDITEFCNLISTDPANGKRSSAKAFCVAKASSSTAPGSTNSQPPDLSALDSLAKEIESHLTDPKTAGAGTKIQEQYESEICGKVHQAVKNLPYEILDDPKFWQYLAVQYFSTFIMWRESGALKSGNILTYFRATGVECIPLRLYLRGQVVFEATGKYDLASAIPEGTDFWRSHILRVNTGKDRNIVRALAEMQRDKRMLRDQLRSVARLINRMRANVFLSEYDAVKGKSIVDELRKLSSSDEK
jgi:hypothetical protein